ncbi:hypothetical protein OA90_03050 [Labrenzia sp. OB1]|nr:hypothetical protein OA90_03050 [Labrenzia sp. OB1]
MRQWFPAKSMMRPRGITWGWLFLVRHLYVAGLWRKLINEDEMVWEMAEPRQEACDERASYPVKHADDMG